MAGHLEVDIGGVSADFNGTPLPVTTSGGVAGTTYAASVQVTATGTPGTLASASSTRKVLILQALPTNTASVFYGPATVSATTGDMIQPGQKIVLTGSDVPLNLTQVVSASGSQVVIVTTGT